MLDRQRDPQRPDRAGAANLAYVPAPGRSTRIEQLDEGDDRPPAVAPEAAQPEPPAPASVDAEEPRAIGRLQLSGGTPAATAAAPETSGAANGSEIISDPHTDAHASRFEQHVARTKKPHWAKQDRFNHPGVKSSPMHDKHQVGRPGVRVDHRDLFTIKNESATRYTFVMTNGKRVVTPFDQVLKANITTINYKFENKPAPPGKYRLLLNPATPVHLDIEGKPTLCVLTWFSKFGSAWIPLDDLDGDKSQFTAAIHQHASTLPADAHGATVKYIVRNDKVGTNQKATKTDRGDEEKPGSPDMLGPDINSGDNVQHYLTESHAGQKFDAQGNAIGKENHETVNICQSLPQPHTPPIAIDIARAGDPFFAMKDPSFMRPVAVYANHAKYSTRQMSWVFGFVGKLENGTWEADHARRGWVPLRTLALASQVKVTKR